MRRSKNPAEIVKFTDVSQQNHSLHVQRRGYVLKADLEIRGFQYWVIQQSSETFNYLAN